MSEAPDDIASVAARGLTDPSSRTAEEVQSLCGPALTSRQAASAGHVRRRSRRIDGSAARVPAQGARRRNQPGFAANVEELEGWVAGLDAELAI